MKRNNFCDETNSILVFDATLLDYPAGNGCQPAWQSVRASEHHRQGVFWKTVGQRVQLDRQCRTRFFRRGYLDFHVAREVADS